MKNIILISLFFISFSIAQEMPWGGSLFLPQTTWTLSLSIRQAWEFPEIPRVECLFSTETRMMKPNICFIQLPEMEDLVQHFVWKTVKMHLNTFIHWDLGLKLETPMSWVVFNGFQNRDSGLVH